MQPYEIIVSPFEVYIADEGTAFPAIDADMSSESDWHLLGKNGTRNYSEDGVTVTHEQDVERHRTAGATGPVKASRTEEDLVIGFTLHDLTLEEYVYALSGQTITEEAAGASDAGYKTVGLSLGLDIATHALLVRGPSPYLADHKMQYQVKRVYHEGSPEITYQKGEMAGIEFEFVALEDPSASDEHERFGTLVAANAAATE